MSPFPRPVASRRLAVMPLLAMMCAESACARCRSPTRNDDHSRVSGPARLGEADPRAVREASAPSGGYCDPTFCATTPTCPGTGQGAVNLSGQTLTNVNFANQPRGYLVGANVSNATLVGVNFSGLDLTKANFSGVKTVANTDGTLTDFTNTQLTGTCFSGADLSGADLQFAVFNGTDFTCASLLNAKFGPMLGFQGDPTTRTRFDHSQLGIARSGDSFLFPLDGMSKDMPTFWSQTDFTCTHFVGLAKTNFTPAGRDMSHAALRGVVLDGFDFYDDASSTGCVLDGADLTHASLKGADLREASLDGVKLVSANLGGSNLTQAVFYRTTASDLTRAILDRSTLNRAQLNHATLAGAMLNLVQAQHAIFDDSTMQATETDSVASVISSTFSYASFDNAALNNVTFSRSTLSHASLKALTLSGTRFLNSLLIDVKFENATLQDVDLTGAQLNNADFKGTTFTGTKTGAGVNFTCSQLGGADFTNAILVKANFQAAVVPPDAQCCPQVSGVFCGDAVDGTDYGHTTLPVPSVSSVVTYPDGSTGLRSGTQWQIPGWTTQLCGNGQSAIVWSAPNCGSTPATVQIKDPNLEACLQGILFNGANQPITKEAAATLQFISCPNKGISDLTGLTKDNFPAIKTLDLSANSLSGTGDFSQFSEQLQTVSVSYNKYTSLVFSPDKQASLFRLEASNNQITSVQVSANTYLHYIDLSHNMLADTQSFFAQRDNQVAYLDLSFNNITSIGDASVLKTAQTLYLEHNSLTTIGSVSDLWAHGNGTLSYLTLDQNACFQCGTLGVERNVWEQLGCGCDASTCSVCK